MSELWLDFYKSIPEFGLGVLLGYALGTFINAARAITSVCILEGESMKENPSIRDRAANWASKVRGIHVLGVVILALTGFSALQSVQASEETQRIALCQEAYSNGFADALDKRTEYNSSRQESLDKLMRTFGDVVAMPSDDGALRIRAALAEYNSESAKAKQAQIDNPYPQAPRDLCK